MVSSSITTQLLSNFFSNVQHNPVFLFSFIIPIVMLLVTSLAVRRYSKKTRIDGPPTLEQKKEKFIIPRDFFNDETNKIREQDFAHFLNPISSEFKMLRDYHERFRILEKQYRRYAVMRQSSRKKRKKAGEEGQKKTFDDILNLYNKLRNNKFEIVEFEHEEERIL